MNIRSLVLSVLGLIGLSVGNLSAQVPQLINYQGRVAVAGVNFDGSGDFKFALVNGSGTTTYWSNDGSSSFGAEPTNAVTLTVARGLYSVLLGDATLTNMTVVPSTVFQNADVYLRVWFNDGVNGSQQLVPDQRIAAVGYAMIASEALTVPDGAITSAKIASGAVESDKIASGAIGSGQLADGAVQANLEASGQSGVGSGGVVLSETINYDLQTAGYVRIGTAMTDEFWEERTNGTAPSERYRHSSVWTGSEVLIWGGQDSGNYFNDGGRYDPAVNSWSSISTADAPSARFLPTVVWTGSEMLVWGGGSIGGGGNFNDGGRYDPATNNWTLITTTGAPSARHGHEGVWSGSEMLVWSGYDDNFVLLNDGARYDPTSDSWTPITTTGAPVGRYRHTCLWTGSEMLVWGGEGSGGFLNDGGRYNPTADSWALITTTGAPSPRWLHTSVWTGSEMLVWGGADDFGGFLNDGGRYDPVADSWALITTTGAPSPRWLHTSVWSGSEMLVWGGRDDFNQFADGGRYDPVADVWTSIATVGAPTKRYRHTSVWTGSEMILFGGSWENETTFNSEYLNDGGRYDPAVNSWSSISTADAPSARFLPTVVWTGSEMLVWGGGSIGGGGNFNDGGRYDPATNNWTLITTTGAPSARHGHEGVWSGSEMLVWSGYDDNFVLLNDGARYDPTSDSWTPITTTGAPVGRYRHTCLWTGSEMLVWGGEGSGGFLNDGGRYNPTADSWALITTTGAPSPRWLHTSVWTGSEMLVWGGADDFGGFLNDGGRYDPVADSWALITTTGAPSPRWLHTSVWSGSEMLVWGGRDDFNQFADGGRYDPVADVWTSIATVGAPTKRYRHTSVWTGSEMLVFGGSWENEITFNSEYLNDGGRYTPTSDSWSSISTADAPSPRYRHSSVWTGSEMLIWGGQDSGNYFNDTFSYTPSKKMYLYQRP